MKHTQCKRYHVNREKEAYVETMNGTILCKYNITLQGHEATEQMHHDYTEMEAFKAEQRIRINNE